MICKLLEYNAYTNKIVTLFFTIYANCQRRYNGVPVSQEPYAWLGGRASDAILDHNMISKKVATVIMVDAYKRAWGHHHPDSGR